MTDDDRDRSSVALILAAAGLGTRLGADQPKALVRVDGRSLIDHVLRTVEQVGAIDLVIVSGPPSHLTEVSAVCDAWPHLPVLIVPGGQTRQESVRAALAVVPGEADVVLVHDAARAFAPPELFYAVIQAVRRSGDAIVPGIRISDTVKQIDEKRSVEATLDRDQLVAVQTPQGFPRQVIIAAHEDIDDGFASTDDAALVERHGGRVEVIPGRAEAFKITTAFDLDVAESVARAARPGSTDR